MKPIYRSLIIATMFALLPLSACGAKSKSAAQPHEKASVVNKPEQTVKLSQHASERLQIMTQPITEVSIARTRVVGAEVVAGSSKNASTVRVKVNLSDSDAAALDGKQLARVRYLGAIEDADEPGVEAELDDSEDDAGAPDDEDKAVYFRIKGSGHSLAVGQQATVQFALQGGNITHKVVPYSALIYDLKGAQWVYIATSALTYQRQQVKVDFIEGDTVYLSEGPAAGALVVSQGPAELYGAETGVGK